MILTIVIAVICILLTLHFIRDIRASQRSIALLKIEEQELGAQLEAERDQEISDAYAKVQEAEQELLVRGMVVDQLALKEADLKRQLAELDAKS